MKWFFSLNLWMCELVQPVSKRPFLNWPYWTGSETLNLLREGTMWGGLIYSECYGVACSVWGAERIMRLYHSINTEWHHRAHNKSCRHSLRRRGQNCADIFNTLGLKCISYTKSNTLQNLLLPFLRKPMRAQVCVCVSETEKRVRWCLLYQCFVNYLDALHMCAIGVVLKIVNLLFRMSLRPSKSK